MSHIDADKIIAHIAQRMVSLSTNRFGSSPLVYSDAVAALEPVRELIAGAQAFRDHADHLRLFSALRAIEKENDE